MDFVHISILLSLSVTMVDGGIKSAYVCYNSRGSPCISTTLTCKEGQVITMEGISDTYNITIGHTENQCESETECNTGDCCRSSGDDEPITALFEDRVEIYDKCSNQQSCNVTSPYVNNTDYGYMKYIYFCVDDQQTINITNDIEDSFKGDTYFYLSGSSRSQLTRCCQFTSSVTISVNSYYINMDAESCRGIKINNQTLFDCSTEDRLIKLHEKLISGVEIDIELLHIEPQDVIWINLDIGKDSLLNVRCRSCNSTETSSQETTATGTDITTVLSLNPSPKHSDIIIIMLSVLLCVLGVIAMVYVFRKFKMNIFSTSCVKSNGTEGGNSHIINGGSQSISSQDYYEEIPFKNTSHHYADPIDILQTHEQDNVNGASAFPLYHLERSVFVNSKEQEDCSRSDLRKREIDMGYTQVNKKFRVDMIEDIRSNSMESITDQDYDHLGSDKKTKSANTSQSDYDHICINN